MQYVVVTLSGVGILGPFPSEDAAIQYAKSTFTNTKWMVRPIYPPA